MVLAFFGGKLIIYTRNHYNYNSATYTLFYYFYIYTPLSVLALRRHRVPAVLDVQDYYPQLLEKQFLFNVPTWIRAMWKVITALFPTRLIEKINVCPGDVSTDFYKPIGKYVSKDQFPEKLGGKMQDWPPPSIAELRYHKENSEN